MFLRVLISHEANATWMRCVNDEAHELLGGTLTGQDIAPNYITKTGPATVR